MFSDNKFLCLSHQEPAGSSRARISNGPFPLYVLLDNIIPIFICYFNVIIFTNYESSYTTQTIFLRPWVNLFSFFLLGKYYLDRCECQEITFSTKNHI